MTWNIWCPLLFVLIFWTKISLKISYRYISFLLFHIFWNILLLWLKTQSNFNTSIKILQELHVKKTLLFFSFLVQVKTVNRKFTRTKENQTKELKLVSEKEFIPFNNERLMSERKSNRKTQPSFHVIQLKIFIAFSCSFFWRNAQVLPLILFIFHFNWVTWGAFG